MWSCAARHSATTDTDGVSRVLGRTLGEGHSAILAEGGRLYSPYRPAAPARKASRLDPVAALRGD